MIEHNDDGSVKKAIKYYHSIGTCPKCGRPDKRLYRFKGQLICGGCKQVFYKSARLLQCPVRKENPDTPPIKNDCIETDLLAKEVGIMPEDDAAGEDVTLHYLDDEDPYLDMVVLEERRKRDAVLGMMGDSRLNEVPEYPSLILRFEDDRDKKILSWLQDEAELYRRTIEQQALWILQCQMLNVP